MAEWDGQGLPPVAAERIRRAAASGLRTSLLSTPAAAGLRGVDLTPVGEVMGCVVQGQQVRYYDAAGYERGIRRGYRVALDRMRVEARGIGAHGVVGVRIQTKPVGGFATEFVVLGTAVHAPWPPTGHLFTTELSGTDVAKLLHGGWRPVDVAVAVAVDAVQVDYTTRSRMTPFAGNNEIPVFTRLITRVRSRARAELDAAVHSGHAEGAIVGALSVDSWAYQEAVVFAMATAFGTTIVHDPGARRAPTGALTVMPLTENRNRR
ncbi:heavy metal-binding domain-containing protein [Kutzneria viridogrisea]|uniref:Uncharacterized protein n=2 Tax=Kutzneria TaxID=43356 RepID=W5WJ85_9PSEU|nr:heavy metal-binding domain-containing protein [Kutzneria albida]AHI00806.1 hypothetical protein KALB_7448 [Kutzneria albida DSM 43870]MBA8926083.1 uncharacterized protein YbjQ (UPF0145 family) [Kutzneria viridogrisea]